MTTVVSFDLMHHDDVYVFRPEISHIFLCNAAESMLIVCSISMNFRLSHVSFASLHFVSISPLIALYFSMLLLSVGCLSSRDLIYGLSSICSFSVSPSLELSLLQLLP